MNLKRDNPAIGDGVFVIRRLEKASIVTCPKCMGHGDNRRGFCKSCGGSGYIKLTLHYDYEITKGILKKINAKEGYAHIEIIYYGVNFPNIGDAVHVFPSAMVQPSQERAEAVMENRQMCFLGGISKDKKTIALVNTRLEQLKDEEKRLKEYLGELALEML